MYNVYKTANELTRLYKGKIVMFYLQIYIYIY